MPLYRLERTIRETCEDDTCLELRLDAMAETALRLHGQIVADGRLDARDVPALLSLLELVPALRAECAESLRYNRRVNGLFGQLVSDRRTAARWGKSEPDGDGGLARAA